MTYQDILERYINSDDFVDGVVRSTKAGWGGVELLPSGSWRNLRRNQIGNKYETPGVILRLPELAAEEIEDIDEGPEDLYEYDLHQRVMQFREDVIIPMLLQVHNTILLQWVELEEKSAHHTFVLSGR